MSPIHMYDIWIVDRIDTSACMCTSLVGLSSYLHIIEGKKDDQSIHNDQFCYAFSFIDI